MTAYNYRVPDFNFFADSAEDDQIIEANLGIDNENDVFSTPRCVLNVNPNLNDQNLLSSSTLLTESETENSIRKSLSVGNLNDDVLLRNRMNGLKISETNDKNLHQNKLQNGDGKQCTRLRSLSQSDHYRARQSKAASQENLGNTKFVSMAEAIRQFQQRTPLRFHSKSKLDNQTFGGGFNPRTNLTVAQSPALQTKKRMRVTNIISHEERELKDYEEAQKFKIKANPLNANILNTPPAISKSKKPTTIPQPFNLTEVSEKSKSLSSISSPSFEFHAKPVPKFINEPPKPIMKSTLSTNPRTPTFLRKTTAKVCVNDKEPVKAAYKVGPTKLIPFSFDEKIEEMKKRKEKMLNEVLEKQKKAREFHAQPIPKKILKYKGSNLSLNKLPESDRDMTTQNTTVVDGVFKARSAKVLVQQPFIPKKSNKPLTEFVSFPTNSENRAAEREKFLLQLKEKEEMVQRVRKEMEAEKQRLESVEVARIRKQAEYQAQPIRQYKKIKKITPKKITDPVSPKFGYTKNKENISK